MYLNIKFDCEITVGKEHCSILFYRILNNCDSNSPDNPGNFKYGGSIKYPRNATLVLSPSPGNNPYCNSGHSNKWVDLNVGVDAITRFCRETTFGGTNGKGMPSPTTKDRAQKLQFLWPLLRNGQEGSITTHV
jgi:hypothetical protein